MGLPRGSTAPTLRGVLSVRRLAAAEADDAEVVAHVTDVVNRAYKLAEIDLWTKDIPRTDDTDVAASIRKGETAVARSDGARVARRGAALVAAAVVLVAGVAVVGRSLVSPSEAKAAGVRFSLHEGYVDATIDDPSAPAASMEAAFAEYGLDIAVQVVPASPGLVGTITFINHKADFEPIYAPEGSCLLPGGSTRCIVGMRVPTDYSGSWTIVVNGPAAPGERYRSTGSALAPGELLHCSGIRGMTVRRAMPLIDALGVTVAWEGADAVSVGDFYVIDADPVSPGVVSLSLQPDPPSEDDPAAAYYEALARGC